MPVLGLNHINVRTPDFKRTVDFLREALDMKVLPAEPPRGSGAIQHIALSCSDFDGMRARLTALDLSFRVNDIPGTGVRQIFVRDPTDILLELNFSQG